EQYLFNNLNFAAGGGFDYANQPAIDATSIAGNLVITDTLTIRGAEPGLTTITVTLPPQSANNVEVPATNPFNAEDIVVLTNCFAANIFQISSISADGTTISHSNGAGNPGNSTDLIKSNTSNVFSANSATLFKLQDVTYSIGVSGSGSNEPALFRNRNGNNDELLEGIENLQVMYGVDTDGDGAANQYLEPGAVAVADLPNVTAVRLWLVVRSERDFIVDATQPYSINGIEIIPPDRRFRQVFSTTIALRNRAG
ncbi:MAG: hypothetical protein GY779_14910, partial [Gammaproteobacteria bacterium]|nr:hypothetical protein [Gammaproteobacteria bacterium]